VSDHLVIFDVAGTLATAPERGPAERVADALGLDAGELREPLLTYDADGPDDLAAWLGRPEAEDAIEAIWIEDQEAARPLPGALEALERLAGEATLAVLANVWNPYLVGVLDHFGDAFDTHVTYRAYSFATGVALPDPRALTMLLDVAGVPSGRAVYVATDVAAARAVGVRTIQVGADVASVADVDLAAVAWAP
jgi:FMN phosphatase YigB (HAD superfamily)